MSARITLLASLAVAALGASSAAQAQYTIKLGGAYVDPHATSEFNALLLKLRAQGVTVFMVTHDLVGAAEVADRIGFLDHGRIAHEISAHGPQRFDVQHLFQRYADARRAA